MRKAQNYLKLFFDLFEHKSALRGSSRDKSDSRGFRGVLRMGDGIMSAFPALETIVLPVVLLFILLMA